MIFEPVASWYYSGSVMEEFLHIESLSPLNIQSYSETAGEV